MRAGHQTVRSGLEFHERVALFAVDDQDGSFFDAVSLKLGDGGRIGFAGHRQEIERHLVEQVHAGGAARDIKNGFELARPRRGGGIQDGAVVAAGKPDARRPRWRQRRARHTRDIGEGERRTFHRRSQDGGLLVDDGHDVSRLRIGGVRRQIRESLDDAFRLGRRVGENDREIETGVVGRVRLDLNGIIVAPDSWIERGESEPAIAGGGDRDLARRRRRAGIKSQSGDARRGGDGGGVAATAVGDQPHDDGLLAAIQKELVDRVAEIAARIQAAELRGEIGPTHDQRGTVGRPPARPSDRGDGRGGHAGDRMNTARNFLDINSGVGQCRHDRILPQ